MPNHPLIYKIVDRAAWSAAVEQGQFEGAAIDLADGYIHFSTSKQAPETAAKHFNGVDDLLLVAVRSADLGAGLKYEISRGGALFPHLYGSLMMDAVEWAKPLNLGEDGSHIFPELQP